MARYIGPVCRLCRTEQKKLFLKGDRCNSDKCPMNKKRLPPGKAPKARMGKRSEYATQLREKQTLKRAYGLMEAQFRNAFEKALAMPGKTGENLFILLERRLDNVVYRAGLAASRAQARQLVNHGHFLVNDRKVDIPSYRVKQGDVVSVGASSRDINLFKMVREGSARILPKWLTVNFDQLKVTVDSLPERSDIDFALQENMIIEYYSR